MLLMLNTNLPKYLNPTSSLYYQSSQRMINDEENYQVVQPAYYLIDMGFRARSTILITL